MFQLSVSPSCILVLATRLKATQTSRYGHVHFPEYAEQIGFIRGQKYDVNSSQSESVRSLSEMAKSSGSWLIGGAFCLD